MRPGEWLELQNYCPVNAQKLLQQSGVKSFILKENDTSQSLPEHNFILKINKIEQIQSSNWKNSSLFMGFLFCANDETDLSRLSDLMPLKWPISLDYECNNIKKSLSRLNDLNAIPFQYFFCSPKSSMALRSFHQLLQMLPKELHLRRSLERPHEIEDSQFNDWCDLESFEAPLFSRDLVASPRYSVIIPHYETPYFLANMLRHLERANLTEKGALEVLVVDDCSSEMSFSYIQSFAKRNLTYLPLRIFRWPKNYFNTLNKRIFRAGASRNWGATYALGQKLLFLDSDMLVPQNIVASLDKSFEQANFIQFVRMHVPSTDSSEFAEYENLVQSPRLYIEEDKYWRKLFESNDWMQLDDYWKYTCTYALALSKKLFVDLGRFRRNFIHYGFEDTDLGYRAMLNHQRFMINKTPLLHLTQKKDNSQSWFYKINKTERLRPMARTFYSLNYNENMYPKFQSLFD